MKKPKELVIKELKELFDIDNNTNKGSYVFEGNFGISKTHFSRLDVLDMLNYYFNGVSVENGYVKVDSITLVHTTFEVIDVNEIEVNSPEELNKEEPKQEWPKSKGDIVSDNAIAQSKTIQKCMQLDAEMAYKSLPKQETLEEGLLNHIKFCLECGNEAQAIRLIEKYSFEMQEQDKNKYSEEEVIELLLNLPNYFISTHKDQRINEWLEQFKNK